MFEAHHLGVFVCMVVEEGQPLFQSLKHLFSVSTCHVFTCVGVAVSLASLSYAGIR